MKKLFALIAALALMLAGCGESAELEESSQVVESSSSSNAASAPEEASKVSSSEELIPSSVSEEPVSEVSSELPEGPILDEELSQMMMDYMQDSFGGAGNPELATSWYPYIDEIHIYLDGDVKYAEVLATETPVDSTLRMYTSSYKADLLDEYEVFIDLLLHAQTSLGWDDIDTCIAAENIYNIFTDAPNHELHYAVLISLGLDPYQYIADAVDGYTASMVRRDIGSQYFVSSPDCARLILQGIIVHHFAGHGFTEANADRIAHTIKANDQDLGLTRVDVVDPQGKVVYTVKDEI